MGRPRNFDDSIFIDSLGSGSFLSGSGALGSGSNSSGVPISLNRSRDVSRRGEGLRVVSNGKGLSVTLTNAKDEKLVRAVIAEAAKQADQHDMHVDLHIDGEPDIGSGYIGYLGDNGGIAGLCSDKVTGLSSCSWLDDLIIESPKPDLSAIRIENPFVNRVKDPFITIKPIYEPPPPAAPIICRAPASPPCQGPAYSAIRKPENSKHNSTEFTQCAVGLLIAISCFTAILLFVSGIVWAILPLVSKH